MMTLFGMSFDRSEEYSLHCTEPYCTMTVGLMTPQEKGPARQSIKTIRRLAVTREPRAVSLESFLVT